MVFLTKLGEFEDILRTYAPTVQMEEWEPERIGLLQEINLCISIFELANFQTWSLGMPWTGLQCRQGPVGENVVFDVFGGRMRETTD